MNIRKITNAYYSKFCCSNIDLLDKGTYFIESSERNANMLGFGCKFSIYVFKSDEKTIISYSPEYRDKLNVVKLENNPKIIIDLLLEKLPEIVIRKLFLYTGNKTLDTTGVIKLCKEHYYDYEIFFLSLHPNANISDGWLKEYFEEKTAKGYMFGYFDKDKLVTVSDAPDMPYMNGIIQHTGIATVKEYRNKGYAKKVAYFAAEELIKSGICPQWETEKSNIASINLAKSIGYQEIAEAYILEER